ncbi:transposase [Hallella faecis]|uniref:transposase n=1 Tax=Hallella faecis TaxID=2841596 RepID=UPI003F8CF13F
MSKVQFIPNLSKEILLFPSRIDEDIADDAPVRIIDYVLDKIDISNILKLYHVKGRNAFYPRMMLKVIIYAYMNNIYSCRRIEELLKRRFLLPIAIKIKKSMFFQETMLLNTILRT